MSKILIVEDDSSIKRELNELLKNAGYETECIENFDKSLELILYSDADLILYYPLLQIGYKNDIM